MKVVLTIFKLMVLKSGSLEETIEYLDKNLDKKEKYHVISKLISALTLSQVESLLDKLEQKQADLILEKETSALFDIRLAANNNSYAYLKRLGKEYPNLYLGPIYFKQGTVYKLTNKHTNAQKVIRSLGLEQRGLQTYLKIEFLLPQKEVREYLFYDADLTLPRIPQKIDLEKIEENLSEGDKHIFFSNIEKNISNINKYKSIIQPREDWSAIFLKKDWQVEEIRESVNSSSTIDLKVNEIDQLKKNKLIVDNTSNTNSPYLSNLTNKQVVTTSHENSSNKKSPKQSLQTKKIQFSVQVGNYFHTQVESYLHQWTRLSQILPNNPQLSLLVEANRLVLSNLSNNKILVEYDRKLRRLNAKSPRLLYSLVYEIVSNVAINNFIPSEQRSLGQKWLSHLQNPPLHDNKILLASMFDL